MRLKSPERAINREFFLTLRVADVRDSTMVRNDEAFFRGDWTGVTKILALDLLEQVGELGYIPFGHRDYKLAGKIANGNRAVRTGDMPIQFPISQKGKFNPFAISQNIWTKGIDIISARQYREELEGKTQIPLSQLKTDSREPWRGFGFGTFLSAVSLAWLKEKRFSEIDFHGNISDEFRGIMDKLGRSTQNNIRQDLDTFNWNYINDCVGKFIP